MLVSVDREITERRDGSCGDSTSKVESDKLVSAESFSIIGLCE